jgi:hypothetical protein
MALRKAAAPIVIETVKLDWALVPSAVQVALNPPKFPSFEAASSAGARTPDSSRSGGG